MEKTLRLDKLLSDSGQWSRKEAKQLLRQTSKRSGEIAFEVGYRDPRYFSFIFKKTQGCTPSSYRSGEAGAS